ncbi:Fip1 motif-domain-containing protein [Dipodascopsis uninucleata]
MYEDEDDEFLYGSSSKKVKLDDDNSGHGGEEDQLGSGIDIPRSSVVNNPGFSEAADAAAEKDQSKAYDFDNDDDDDEDSDIEFVIEAKPGQSVDPPAGKTPYSSMRLAPKSSAKATGQSNINEAEEEANNDFSTSQKVGVDLSKVPELDGKPLTSVDLENFEDKPWRKPGADITDYFNYGFDEFTWTTYCLRQDKFRQEYDANKMIQEMMQLQMAMPFMQQNAYNNAYGTGTGAGGYYPQAMNMNGSGNSGNYYGNNSGSNSNY